MTQFLTSFQFRLFRALHRLEAHPENAKTKKRFKHKKWKRGDDQKQKKSDDQNGNRPLQFLSLSGPFSKLVDACELQG